MAFPTSPTNGQTATVNGVVYTYTTALGAWTVTTSNGGDISANTIASSGAITGSTTLSVVGNITGGNILTSGAVRVNGITNSGGNATGNIGNSTGYFNTVFATATTALYADLAEYYQADADYGPGTVVSFGGRNEVTISSVASDSKVAGVISTNPAHVMNSGRNYENGVIVALTGRVPTKVTGRVNKGDMMVSAGDGHAQACTTPAIGSILGKALEDFDGDTGVIEVVIGKL
jgi:hypothetical protein